MKRHLSLFLGPGFRKMTGTFGLILHSFLFFGVLKDSVFKKMLLLFHAEHTEHTRQKPEIPFQLPLEGFPILRLRSVHLSCRGFLSDFQCHSKNLSSSTAFDGFSDSDISLSLTDLGACRGSGCFSSIFIWQRNAEQTVERSK